MNILTYIPIGSKNAVTRTDLCRLTGLDDRAVRELIHIARRTTPILNMQDGRGYFVPNMKEKYDSDLLKKYVRQEKNRLKSIGWALKSARKMLKNVDGRDGC